VRLLDLNLLLYALDDSSPLHAEARPWVERTLSGPGTVALAWSVLLGFVRLSTRAAVFTSPLRVDEALDIVGGWLELPTVTVIHPTERHLPVLRELLAPLGTGGNLTTDAHLAALAIEHGAELCSTDADFSRFPGLRWVHPFR
jgi:toxin-antitoxin system PIN domain toxin